MNIYASYLTDSKISIVNILHVHVVPFLLYPSLDSFANSCVMWTIREVVILATSSELHEGYNLWYLRGDNKKRKKSDTNIWQIYIYIYIYIYRSEYAKSFGNGERWSQRECNSGKA